MKSSACRFLGVVLALSLLAGCRGAREDSDASGQRSEAEMSSIGAVGGADSLESSDAGEVEPGSQPDPQAESGDTINAALSAIPGAPVILRVWRTACSC